MTLYSSTISEYNGEQQKLLKECAAVLTNMLSSLASPFDASEDSHEHSTGLGISNASPAGFETSAVESELTH